MLRGAFVKLRHDGAGTDTPRVWKHGRAAPDRTLPQSDRHTQNTALKDVACGRAWRGESPRRGKDGAQFSRMRSVSTRQAHWGRMWEDVWCWDGGGAPGTRSQRSSCCEEMIRRGRNSHKGAQFLCPLVVLRGILTRGRIFVPPLEVKSGKWEAGSGKWEVGSGKWEVGRPIEAQSDTVCTQTRHGGSCGEGVGTGKSPDRSSS
jgi:hypothetical protein